MKCIQGDVRAEFEMFANGHSASADKKLWEQATQHANRWRLLLQFDTDDYLNVMWGDAGTLYFCIREDDLRAGRFDNASDICQCY